MYCSNPDILVWPDGFWLFKRDYSWEEYKFIGDDFYTIPHGSAEWERFMFENKELNDE